MSSEKADARQGGGSEAVMRVSREDYVDVTERKLGVKKGHRFRKSGVSRMPLKTLNILAKQFLI